VKHSSDQPAEPAPGPHANSMFAAIRSRASQIPASSIILHRAGSRRECRFAYHAITPIIFGLVQRRIGASHDLLDRAICLPPCRYADADRHLYQSVTKC
jgi:hypothetical protein